MTIKIYELAKELNIASKELVEKINAMGIEAKSHMSSVDDKIAAELRNSLGGKHIANSETKVVKAVPKKKEKESDNEPRVTVKAANIKPPVPTKKAAPVKKPAAHTEERPAARPPAGRPLPKNAVPQRKKPIIGTPVVNKELDEREKKSAEAPAIKIEAEVIVKEEPKTEETKVKAVEPAKAKESAKAPEIKKEAPKKDEARKETRTFGREDRPARKRDDRGAQRRDDRPARKDDRFKKNDERKKPDRDRRPAPRRDTAPAPDMGVQKPNQKKMDDKTRKNKEQRDKFSKLEHGRKKGGIGKNFAERSLEKKERKKHSRPKKEEPVEETIVIPEGSTAVTVPITVAGFCEQLEISTATVIMALMKLGIMANINQNLDEMTVEILAAELGIDVTVTNVEEELVEEGIEDFEDREEDLKPRPPIITVMGHVDHGKTSLLDAIRSTNVTASESGGITQHIGASEVEINGQKIVFLDTPGHEAFTAMRARGAHVTDIAVLVVAADDGVMPQTIESISHAKAAGVPIIVAINKMDKPAANPDRVKQELTEHGILVEDWGGDVISVPVSAKTGEGITNLLEMILLQAEMLELKANPARLAQGTVVEARLDKAKGPVATLLVLNGTLKSGQSVVAGTSCGRIRLMTNYKGKKISKAGPATAVEILGLTEVPQAGDEFNAVKEDRIAREIAENRKLKLREEVLAKNSASTLEQLFSQIQEGEVKDLNLIVKADVQGSVGAIVASLEKLKNENVRVKIIHTGVGTVNESDVMLAGTSGAVIIGFNVRPSSAVQNMADRDNIQIRTYRVIYDIINDVEDAMKGMLDPEFKEVVLGKIEVRETFKVPGVGIIAGAYVAEGKAVRNAEVRLVRDGIVIHEGKISSLKRFKDDAKEVQHGFECGIGIEDYNDIKIGDVIECFVMEEIER
jgi:translation initiation factor IF-2